MKQTTIIICLGNKVSCCGNGDDIFNEGSHQNKPAFLLLEFSCLNALIIVVKCSELSLK